MPLAPASPDQVEQWDALLQNRPNAHFLQSSFWSAFKSRHGWQSHPLFFRTDDIGLPVLALTRTISRLSLDVAYIPKGPAIPEDQPETWRQFLTDVTGYFGRSRRLAILKIEPEVLAANKSVETIFHQARFSQSALHPQFKRTSWVDLKPSETDILNSFHTKTRYNIRLAERKEVIIREVVDAASLEVFYQLYRETSLRQNFPARDAGYYKALWADLAERDMGTLLLATHKDIPVAGVYIIRFGNRAYYQFGASSEQHRTLMAPHLLQWRAIQWARSLGCEVYDMVGLPETEDPADPFYGVWRFKQGFRGEDRTFLGAMDYYPNAVYRTFLPRTLSLYKRWLWKARREVFF
jgi:lipid II:glycine glycyltransferase (peptidoglycan interpeptide bridge formation enzyme)